MKVLVLDAMGVIYSIGDDVSDLLCPFIAEKGGTHDADVINRLYDEACLGRATTAEFWKGVGLSPVLEDEYLKRHQLSTGILELLENMRSRGIPVWCLSNDVAEWSRKLRARFGLEKYFRGFVVSGDVRLRKPDPAIFRLLTEEAQAAPQDILYVDDSRKNLGAAAALGWRTVLFSPSGDAYAPDPNPYPSPYAHDDSTKQRMARTFDDVLGFMA